MLCGTLGTNSTLKGMLEVNSRTTLTLLFDTLRHAMCGKDERATKRAAADAARVPLNNKARTIEAETSPHLTFYAASLNSTADVQPIRQPARTARYGQLTGFARRICELGADFPEAFGWVYTKLEALARDVEAATSAPPSAHTQPARPHAPAPLLSSVPLHPSVSTDVMQMPPHKKRQRGNTAERRQMSAAEAAAKRACINPSQSI